ncbi:hypothetical protein LTR36_010200 [Oleoguttula mirabilis]|uniref:Glutathione synthetase n=1 Tax=Oleoguttula mirabilis TaxID=1507867 RepID=A0AAV9JS61_9PEZI|nr:hypothetical protein LTR36_010200 [Oleoguttula mirabilis]
MPTSYCLPKDPPPGDEVSAVGGSKLSEEHLAQLVTDIKDYQLTHGNVLKLVRFEEATRVPSIGVGVSVLPTPFPRRCFNEAWALQRCMNELYIRAGTDEQWLHTILQPLMERDGFLAALWDVHVDVRKAGVVQDVVCGIFRSDYMHQPCAVDHATLKQVEVNTFSAAGACHAEHVANMHRHLQRMRRVAKLDNEHDRDSLLSPGDNINSLVAALITAYQAYRLPSQHSYCILMVVQPYNFNVADERPIEYGLWDAGIPCYRCDWQEVLNRTTLTTDRKLLYRLPGSQTELEVTVVYYRAGYDAAEYDTQGMQVRLRLELSTAIKCPDVLTHLTTFKAVQQALTEPDVLKRFLPVGDAERVRDTFMPISTLDTSAKGLQARLNATDAAQAVHYVLKPNLEGGGNNIYGSKIPALLGSLPEEEWSKYILMRLIEPPEEIQGVLLTAEELYQGPVVSELGIFGTALWRREASGGVEMLRNESAGWTFKTKPSKVDEMSVVKGYGCFDCPKLTE